LRIDADVESFDKSGLRFSRLLYSALMFVPLDDVRYPPRSSPGDRVAIVSPSSAAAGEFPHVHELGLQRLREVFDLVPLEYPTTRVESSPRKRADDLMQAFCDDSVTAIMATIGGDDQLTVLKHLDFEVIAANPKPFFGYSDNTNFLNALVHCGVVGYHGGSTMVHLGRSGSMHPLTEASLRAALFTGGRYQLQPASTFSNYGTSWDDPANLTREPNVRTASPWEWNGAKELVHGRVWGGCIEILDWTMQIGQWIAPANHYANSVLFLETSEEMPSGEYLFRTLRNMGERGILEQIRALIIARPMTEEFGVADTAEETIRERERDHRDGILRAVELYHPNLPIVFGIEAGHTDPQQIIPLGGHIEVDMIDECIHVTY
jgi:muramoyltetrapeptide carboxypeptidase LdcA involved in peptidoglycan recycling